MNAIYARVSTEEQAKSGYGIDSQLSACREKLKSLGLSADAEYVDDGYSGEFIDRPSMDRLRNDLRAGIIDCIAVYDPDRMARNLTHMLLIADDIEKAGAKLTFITGDYDASPEGRLFFSIRGAIAAFEKEKIRERTSRGKRTKALQGKIVQNCYAYGYSWDEKNSLYVINEPEADVVRLIYSLCLDNKLGTSRIADELNRRQLVNKNGRPFKPSLVNAILKKPMYYGEYQQFSLSSKQIGQKKVKATKSPMEHRVKINIPPIVTKDRWEAVQEQLALNKSIAKRNTEYDYLLQGLLYCPLCPRKLTATVCHSNRKNKKEVLYHYYFCTTGKKPEYKIKCGNKHIPAQALDDQVWAALLTIAKDSSKLADFLLQKEDTDYTAELTALTKQKETLEKRKSGIVAWFSDGMIDNDTATKQINALNKELTSLIKDISALSNLQSKNKPAEIPVDDILQAATFEQKRNALLNFPYKIYAKRENDEVCFWFEK